MSQSPLSQQSPSVKLRGVNLGGWLVLEKWMTPSVFEGLQATDETTWCAELGAAATQRLQQHWNTFITREDFVWLHEQCWDKDFQVADVFILLKRDELCPRYARHFKAAV